MINFFFFFFSQQSPNIPRDILLHRLLREFHPFQGLPQALAIMAVTKEKDILQKLTLSYIQKTMHTYTHQTLKYMYIHTNTVKIHTHPSRFPYYYNKCSDRTKYPDGVNCITRTLSYLF